MNELHSDLKQKLSKLTEKAFQKSTSIHCVRISERVSCNLYSHNLNNLIFFCPK